MANALDFLTAVGPPAVSATVGLLGNNSATGAQTGGINNASTTISNNGQALQNLYNQNYTQQQSMLAPYTAGGPANVGMLNAGLQPGGGLADPYGKTFNFTGADLQNSPGYQFQLAQGQKAIDASRAAMGTRFSGGAAKAADQFNVDYAGTKFNDAFNQAQSTYNTNLNQFETDQANRYNRLSGTVGQNQAATQSAVNSTQNYATESGQLGMATSADLANLQLGLANAQAAGDTKQANIIQNAIAAGTAGVKGLQAVNSAGTPGALPTAASGPSDSMAGIVGQMGPADQAAASIPDIGAGLGVNAAPYAPAAIGTELTGAAGAAGAEAAGGAGAALAGAAGAGADAALPASLSSIPGLAATAPDVLVGTTDTASAGLGASGGVLPQIGAFLTNPITIGVGAALVAGYAIIRASQVHPVANQWTSKVQTPFGDKLTQSVQAFNAALKSGQMTKPQAAAAVQQIQQMTQAYQAAEQQFAAKGSKQKTVIDQSEAEMTKDFGANFSTLLSDLNGQVQGLAA